MGLNNIIELWENIDGDLRFDAYIKQNTRNTNKELRNEVCILKDIITKWENVSANLEYIISENAQQIDEFKELKKDSEMLKKVVKIVEMWDICPSDNDMHRIYELIKDYIPKVESENHVIRIPLPTRKKIVDEENEISNEIYNCNCDIIMYIRE